MVSAGTDGSIAAWDFRSLSDTTSGGDHHPGSKKKNNNRACKIVRQPSTTMSHEEAVAGSTLLGWGVKDPMQTFLSVGSDAILREWNVSSGELVDESPTGHCDGISSFQSFANGRNMFGSPSSSSRNSPSNKGIITSSWDGTIRMRKLVQQKQETQ
jgi:hypothetical protein